MTPTEKLIVKRDGLSRSIEAAKKDIAGWLKWMRECAPPLSYEKIHGCNAFGKPRIKAMTEQALIAAARAEYIDHIPPHILERCGCGRMLHPDDFGYCDYQATGAACGRKLCHYCETVKDGVTICEKCEHEYY